MGLWYWLVDLDRRGRVMADRREYDWWSWMDFETKYQAQVAFLSAAHIAILVIGAVLIHGYKGGLL